MKRTIALFVLFAASAFAQNPDLGVSLGSAGGSPQKRVEVAKQLGASWYRPEAVLLGQAEPRCDDCEVARSGGLKLVLVLRNAVVANKPSSAVSDLPGFQQKVRAAIDRYKPEIVVVESEPENKNSFAGSPEQYSAEVKAACEVAHAADAKCANGGLSSPAMGGVVIDELWKKDQLEAATFAITTELVRAKSESSSISLLGRRIGLEKEVQEAIEKATKNYLEKHRAEIDVSRAFLAAGTGAGTDYANFHWYELKPEEVSTVLDVLGRLNNRPQMTDEVGQREQRGFETGEKIKILMDAGVRPIIWAGVDGKDSVGLVDKNGELRPNAKAFQSAAQKKAAQ